METTARNASLDDLHSLLSVQHDAKHDAVVPARKLWYDDGNLYAQGMGLDGPAGTPGAFNPTEIFDGHLAGVLDIPLPYVRRMRKERVDLLDANVNGWLHRDTRSFFVRTFVDHDALEDGVDGIARALLSDRYRRVDNLDVITSVLSGIRATGVDARIASCNITERRMQVKIVAPDVAVYAPKLLEGYRNPFPDGSEAQRRWVAHTGIEPGDEPVLFAGFVVTNSETGNGAAAIVPVITVLRCLNGLTMTRDVLRNVHLGARLEEGVVAWSEETQRRNLELVTSMTTDAVTTFLNRDYVEAKIAEMEGKAQLALDDPSEVVTLVGQQLRFSQEQTTGIFNHFIRGGQVTAGGVMQAVTSYAQELTDPDEAWELELAALNALDAAAQLASR